MPAMRDLSDELIKIILYIEVDSDLWIIISASGKTLAPVKPTSPRSES
jgi:hypothetical protein